MFPEAKYQRCTVHFCRNTFSGMPCAKVKLAAKALKVVHAQGGRKVTRKKAGTVAEELVRWEAERGRKPICETFLARHKPIRRTLCGNEEGRDFSALLWLGRSPVEPELAARRVLPGPLCFAAQTFHTAQEAGIFWAVPVSRFRRYIVEPSSEIR